MMSWQKAIFFFFFIVCRLPPFPAQFDFNCSLTESDNFAKSHFNCSRSKYNFIYISIIHKNCTRIWMPFYLNIDMMTIAWRKCRKLHMFFMSTFAFMMFLTFHYFRFSFLSFSISSLFSFLHLKGDVICLHLIPNDQFFLLEILSQTENYQIVLLQHIWVFSAGHFFTCLIKFTVRLKLKYLQRKRHI